MTGRELDQLRGYLAAIRRVDDGIDALNGEKVSLLHEAEACGLSKRAVREIVQRRRLDLCGDADLGPVYDALVDEYERELADKRDA